MNLKKYRVLIPEIHYAHYIVEAENPHDAILQVKITDPVMDYEEYSHAMKEDNWMVEEIPNGETEHTK